MVTAGLVKAVATIGDFDWAEHLISSIKDPDRFTEAQISLVNAVATAGDFQRATGLVRAIDSTSRQGEALVCLAQAAIRANDHERFSVLSQRAEELILRITNTHKRAQLLVVLTKSVSVEGEFDHAESLARKITIQGKRAEALTELAGELATNGDIQRFRRIASRAELITRRTSKVWRSILLAELVKAAATAGEFDWAEELARCITIRDRQAIALMDLANKIEATGDLQRARQLINQAEEVIFTIRRPEWQAQALIEFARYAGAERVLPLVARALTLGNWTPALDIVASIQPTTIIEVASEQLWQASGLISLL